MARTREVELIFLIFFSLSTCFAHICLIAPHQRGPLNISTSGNPSCFRHGPPCGGMDAEAPSVTWTAGSSAFVKWQQNYNHYSVGYPGYMDVAIAPLNSMDFKILAVTSDPYVYAQDSQINYTAVVMVPNMECDHCVLRVRYNAHKPGEHTFYQCADVRVTMNQGRLPLKFPTHKSQHQNLLKASLLSLSKTEATSVQAGDTMLYGLMYSPNDPGTVEYVSVNAKTGVMKNINSLKFGVWNWHQRPLESFNPNFILDAVVTVDLPFGVSVMLNHGSTLDLDTPASNMLMIGSTNGSVVRNDKISGTDGKPFSALVFESFQLYLTFAVEEVKPDTGKFIFVVGELNLGGMWTPVIRTSDPEDTYINFQWAEYDPRRQLLFVLLGNENDADGLSARIYTFDIGNKSFMSKVDVDVSQYTFMSMQLYEKTGQLLAVSPGLFPTRYPAYSLVTVDPFTGAVTHIANITQPGIFERYYGGTIFNGLNQDKGTLTYVFRVGDAQADVIATVNLVTMTTTFSPLTNIRHVHNLARV